MKIPDALDVFMFNHHKNHYYDNKKDIETHNFTVILGAKVKFSEYASYIYDSYICSNCNSSIRYVVWQDELLWNPITCEEMQIKKILE